MFRKPQELCRAWGESTRDGVAEEEGEVVKGHVSKRLLFWARVLSGFSCLFVLFLTEYGVGSHCTFLRKVTQGTG